MRSMGVYIHIPFCVRKCAYCDFLSMPAERTRQMEYVRALKREIAQAAQRYSGRTVETVFFGGGTPSLLEAEEIAEILDCLRAQYQVDADTEITLEMNPGTAGADKLLRLRNAGVNRLSIGLQSAVNAELALLGRIHTYEDFLRTFHLAREAAFSNINIDLMSALPGQSTAGWLCTLGTVTALEPEHISAYSLMIEEGTTLYDNLETYPALPDEDEERYIYQVTKQFLAEKGYQRYEISNYARPGYECRHNSIYWQRGVRHTADYVGFGLGASSTVGAERWRNTSDMERYLQQDAAIELDYNSQKTERVCAKKTGHNAIREDLEELSKDDRMEEFMFLGLRMTAGISKQEFEDSFGIALEDIYGDVLRRWTDRNMLIQQGDQIRLTDAGIDVSNVVLADFLL